MRGLRSLLVLSALAVVPAAAHAQDVEQLPAAQAAQIESQDRTISWYMAHTDERKARIKICDDDPGHLENDPDCINAKKADNQAGVNDFKSGLDNTVQGAANFFQGH